VLRARPGFLPAVAILCLLLLTLLAVGQVTHVHSNQSDADHCTLCIVMHTVAPVTATVAAIVMVQVGIPAPLLEPNAVVRQRYSKLFIRPPPTGS
jgi:hypothetical protein